MHWARAIITSASVGKEREAETTQRAPPFLILRWAPSPSLSLCTVTHHVRWHAGMITCPIEANHERTHYIRPSRWSCLREERCFWIASSVVHSKRMRKKSSQNPFSSQTSMGLYKRSALSRTRLSLPDLALHWNWNPRLNWRMFWEPRRERETGNAKWLLEKENAKWLSENLSSAKFNIVIWGRVHAVLMVRSAKPHIRGKWWQYSFKGHASSSLWMP